MTETELEYQFCFNCNDRKNCYTKPKDCTRIKEEIGLQEMTNEEWLRQATTEEMAGAIYEWHSAGYTKGRLGLGLNPITEIVGWLKQPHSSPK